MPDKRRSDMAYWWPTLYASGVPVPRTELITTDVNLMLACFGENLAVALRSALGALLGCCFLFYGEMDDECRARSAAKTPIEADYQI